MNVKNNLILPSLFFFARIVIIISLPIEGILGYGDYWNYINIARSGWPYINMWVEFPPVFPWIAHLLYLVSPNEHGFYYLLATLFCFVQAASIYLFMRLAEKIISDPNLRMLTDSSYAIITLVLPYSWWTFDCITIFFMLLALVAFFEEKDNLFGAAVGLGILTKLFPALLLVLPLRYYPFKRLLRICVTVGALVVGLYLILVLVSPKMTLASISSQFIKGSWETPWALIDGNLNTGNFSADINRNIAETASIRTGNPAIISPWITLAICIVIGYFLFRTYDSLNRGASISLLGVTFCLFYLWSPGWSPQWSLYFIPLFLLGLPIGNALLVSSAFILVNLLEWPVLLSRGLFSSLPLTVGLRTILMVVILLLFWQNRKLPEQDFSQTYNPDIHGATID